MGFNTVIMVLNDALQVGAEDPDLGRRLKEASENWTLLKKGHDNSFYARNERCSSSYGRVISQAHATDYQVTVTHGNMGWRVDDPRMDKYLGWHALDQMKECLERNGYRVTPND